MIGAIACRFAWLGFDCRQQGHDKAATSEEGGCEVASMRSLHTEMVLLVAGNSWLHPCDWSTGC